MAVICCVAVPLQMPHSPRPPSHMLKPQALLDADLMIFVATANTSIISLNLSLMLNKVGFYQARLCLRPQARCYLHTMQMSSSGGSTSLCLLG